MNTVSVQLLSLLNSTVYCVEPSLVTNNVTGEDVLPSKPFSHSFATDNNCEVAVDTGSGFVYPLSCCPASVRLSTNVIEAFVLVRN